MGRRKKLNDPPIPPPEAIRISQKVKLEPGDHVKVSLGPYYLSKSGTKTNMGHQGKGIYISTAEEHNVWVNFYGRKELVYIGPEYVSEATGMIMRPHKVSKIRKK